MQGAIQVLSFTFFYLLLPWLVYVCRDLKQKTVTEIAAERCPRHNVDVSKLK